MTASILAGRAAIPLVSPATPKTVVVATTKTPVEPVPDTVEEIEPVASAAGESANGVDDTNVWPDASAESAFLSEARERGEPVMPVRVESAESEEDLRALPKLDELVNRIPPETRELLEELFRARFVSVRRVKKKDLKNALTGP